MLSIISGSIEGNCLHATKGVLKVIGQ